MAGNVFLFILLVVVPAGNQMQAKRSEESFSSNVRSSGRATKCLLWKPFAQPMSYHGEGGHRV